jgi:GNAT superfamily N-acetyltransferase
MSLPRPRALPGTPLTALASAFNCRFQVEEGPLAPAIHDRAGFDCGVPALNVYIQRFAGQHQRQGIASVFVLTDTEAPSAILGYYTLGAAEADAANLSEADRRRLPRYPLPCFRMGRLAVDARAHGQGIGRVLMGCAVDRCLKAREQVAAYALIVDAKDARAKKFYAHYGFTAFGHQPMTLYLPLGR